MWIQRHSKYFAMLSGKFLLIGCPMEEIITSQTQGEIVGEIPIKSMKFALNFSDKLIEIAQEYAKKNAIEQPICVNGRLVSHIRICGEYYY